MSKKLAGQQVEWDLHENAEALIPLEFTEEIKPDLFGLELTKAQEMTSGLSTTLAEREVLKNAYVDVIELPITTETLPTFKELRLKIVKNRTQGIEKWHKTNKAFYLAGGRFVDAVKNKEIVINELMEAKLLEAEKFFENQEKEKARLLNESRIEKIRPYVDDVTGLDFAVMTDEDFDDYLLGKKTRFENEQKEREAELLRIETERLAEIERQKAIELENAKLKEEAKEKELEERIEKEKQNAILKAVQEARSKVEAELKAKKDAEIKAENERIEKEKTEKLEAEKLAKAPIKKQLSVWVNSFNIEETNIDNETSKQIKEKFEAFKKWSLLQVGSL
jgi:colicin import membrane protein